MPERPKRLREKPLGHLRHLEPFKPINISMKALASYLKDATHELKKVTWPTKNQVVNYSLIVIAMSIGVALFFGILDFVLNLGLTQII